MRLLVVDGSNLLFQMFYGMPERIIGANGRPIQGTLGFVGALLKILRMVRPTHAVVLFDGECHNPRTGLDENYKANRPDYTDVPEEALPFSQLPDIYAALDHLGLRHAETTDCEADDWMAAYAIACGEESQVIIASQDSDLFQLISENVRILRYRGKRTVLCDSAYIMETLGIAPGQYADHKSLTGDSSDNIRGIRGIGPKTATALLRQFGSLEAILAHPEDIARPALRAAIIQNAPRLRTNRLLIRLDGHVPLPFPPKALTWQDRGCTTGQVLEAIGLK